MAERRGVLRVDVKAPRQYGLTNPRYTPILKKAIKGSFRADSLWIRHLPTSVLKLIHDHPLAFGTVRRFRYKDAAAGAAGAALDHPDSKKPPPLVPIQNLMNAAVELTTEDVVPKALVHCRHVKIAAAGSEEVLAGWAEHYEYLVHFDASSIAEWYPEELIAEDLQEAYYNQQMASAKPVSQFMGRDGDKLLVQRPDGTVDKVGERQIFWNELERGARKLHDLEVDAIMYHLYRDQPHSGQRIHLNSSQDSFKNISFPGPEIAHLPPCIDVDGSPVYLASAVDFKGGVHPCKVAPHLAPALVRVPFNGEEVSHYGEYELLPFVPEVMEYVPSSMGRVPEGRNAILGGYEGENKLYHALATIEGVQVPGKAGPQFVSVSYYHFYWDSIRCRTEECFRSRT